MMRDTGSAYAPWAQWGLVATLTLVTMLAQIDKNILVLMVGPIRADLGISDVQISFLIGAAFAVANILVGLPAGWLADRFDRRLIIVVGVLIWSLALAANAATSVFLGLVAARIVVGAAEALIPPASYSLIRDGVEETRRARALSVYTMAIMLGTGLSLVLGGPLMSAIEAAGINSLPLIGKVSHWQATLFIIGLAGLPIGLLIFLNKDPGRQTAPGRSDKPAVSAVARYLMARKNIFIPLLVFSVMNAMINFALATWIPTVVTRQFHLGMKEIGLIQSGMLLTIGPLGLWLAGLAMDRKATGGRASSAALVGIIVTITLTAFTISLCLANTIGWFWFFDALVVLCSTTYLAVGSTIVARTVPSLSVGLVMALVLVLNGLMGQGVGPTLIAFVAQQVYGTGPSALASAMVLVFACAGTIALIAAIWLYTALLRHEQAPDPALAESPAT